MYRIAICDDNKFAISETYEKLCEVLDDLKEQNGVIDYYNGAKQFIKIIWKLVGK
jgi:hypothetical protein